MNNQPVTDSMDWGTLRRYAPNTGRFPLCPELTERQALALLCRILHREGYDDHISGHISLWQPDGTFLVNPWELAWDEVCASDILRVDANLRVLEGDWNPLPAVRLHVDLHLARSDIKLVIHNHPRWASVWAAAHRIPPIYDQTSSLVDSDPALYYEYLGSVDDPRKAQAAVQALGASKWALLANHGLFIVANTVRQAHLRAVTLEWRSRVAWEVEQLGGGEPLRAEVAAKQGQLTDSFGLPFLWEAMVRRELRYGPDVLT